VEPIHAQVLDAACANASNDWTFRISDVVAALPHLNPATVRTHIASRCCSNAPANHQSRYRYFRAHERGVYRVEPAFRRPRGSGPKASQDLILNSMDSGVDSSLIAESMSLTATQRLETMVQAARALEAIRRP
jgi:hypothetical protein